MQNYNTSLLITAIDDSVKLIRVSFPRRTNIGAEDYSYTYKCNIDVEVDDLVVVPETLNGEIADKYTTAIVREVDVDVPADAREYKWVVQRVDFEGYSATIQREDLIKKTVREAEKRTYQRALKEQLTDMLGEEEVRKLTDATFPGAVPSAPATDRDAQLDEKSNTVADPGSSE